MIALLLLIIILELALIAVALSVKKGKLSIKFAVIFGSGVLKQWFSIVA